jgi:DNA polymerase III alpha subunit (gram-positive type)
MMDILERPLAFTDVETTGLDSGTHEIVEIGMILVEQKSLRIIDTFEVKVHPLHIETASEFALKLNGYNPEEWRFALSLEYAMELYADKTKSAIFCAHNVTFDWAFIDAGFKKSGVNNLMDYHRIDLFTAAFRELRNSGLQKFNQNEVAKFLGIPEEPLPHRAINGVWTAYHIYRHLTQAR